MKSTDEAEIKSKEVMMFLLYLIVSLANFLYLDYEHNDRFKVSNPPIVEFALAAGY